MHIYMPYMYIYMYMYVYPTESCTIAIEAAQRNKLPYLASNSYEKAYKPYPLRGLDHIYTSGMGATCS